MAVYHVNTGSEELQLAHPWLSSFLSSNPPVKPPSLAVPPYLHPSGLGSALLSTPLCTCSSQGTNVSILSVLYPDLSPDSHIEDTQN